MYDAHWTRWRERAYRCSCPNWWPFDLTEVGRFEGRMQIVVGDFLGWPRSTIDPRICDLVGDYTPGDWASGGRVYKQCSGCLRRAVRVNGEWWLRVK